MSTENISTNEPVKKEVTPETMEFFRDIIRGIATQMMSDHEDEKSHHLKHESHCHHPEEHHRIPLSPLLTKKNPNDTIEIGSPVRILGKHNKYNIYQVEVIKQSDPVSCGYHTFHNAYVTVLPTIILVRFATVHHYNIEEGVLQIY